MKKEITLGQIVGICVTLLTVLLTGWITTTNKIEAMKIQIQSLQDKNASIERRFERIDDKLDKIYERVNHKD